MSRSPAREGGSYSGLPNLRVSATNGRDDRESARLAAGTELAARPVGQTVVRVSRAAEQARCEQVRLAAELIELYR
jgi:hypothetical protein